MSDFEAGKLFGVKGLVAVITGGGSGIGLMMAKALATNGAHKVYILGRRQEVLEEAAKQASDGVIVPLVCDVTSKDSLQSAAESVKEQTGYVNVLIANSGVGGPQAQGIKPDTSIEDFQSAMWKMDYEKYSDTFAVNVAAVWFTAIAFLKLLDEGNKKANAQASSQIIVTGSIAGLNRQAPGGFAYGQSKAAAHHLIKQLSSNLWPYHLRANGLAPGLYPSDLAAGIIGDGNFPKTIIPAERIGSEEDMAGAILYLTSRAGAYCNGNIIVTDGGRLGMASGTY